MELLINGRGVAPESFMPIGEFTGTPEDLKRLLDDCWHFKVTDEGKILAMSVPDPLER